MKCDFIVLHRKGVRFKHRCIRCGTVTRWTVTQYRPYSLCKRAGLGDRLEKALKLIGIRPPCLGCQRRKERLNELDRKIFRRLWGPKHETYSEEGPPEATPG